MRRPKSISCRFLEERYEFSAHPRCKLLPLAERRRDDPTANMSHDRLLRHERRLALKTTHAEGRDVTIVRDIKSLVKMPHPNKVRFLASRDRLNDPLWSIGQGILVYAPARM